MYQILQLLVSCCKRFSIARGLLLLTQLSLRRGTFQVQIPSCQYPVTLRQNTSDIEVFKKVLLDEEYESHIQNASVIVDLGANIGLSSIFFANRYPGCRIGAAARNIISANSFGGMELSSETGALIFGNYIGSNENGDGGVGNGSVGIQLTNSNGASVGSTIAPNFIVDNGGDGVFLSGGSNYVVRDNAIGVLPTGGAAGNAINGVQLGSNVSGADIRDNTIAYNGHRTTNNTAGIKVTSSSSGNTFSSNAIFANEGYGIDLNGDGVTLNDPLMDTDSGANGSQNFPVIDAIDGSNHIIQFTLASKPNTAYTLQFFANSNCDTNTNCVSKCRKQTSEAS